MMFFDRRFVEADISLRRGGHINRSDLLLYQFLIDNYEDLARFYASYESELIQHPDGFFFLLTTGGHIPSRLLPLPCVHVGMFIALKMRDPEITRSSGRLKLDWLLQSIGASVSRDTLQRVYAPKQKEASADAKITEEIQRALRILAELHFVELQGDAIKPLEAIHRFAEMARHENTPDDLARIVLSEQRGVVFLNDRLEGSGEIAEDNRNDDDGEDHEGTD